MSTTTTITKPAPVIEGSLTAFLSQIDKLGKGAVPAGFLVLIQLFMIQK